jgi:hypothetical protein
MVLVVGRVNVAWNTSLEAEVSTDTHMYGLFYLLLLKIARLVCFCLKGEMVLVVGRVNAAWNT